MKIQHFVYLFFLAIFCRNGITTNFVFDNVIHKSAGLANQIMFFQYALQEIADKYPKSTFLVHGPESDLIANSYKNHSFYDFFRKRTEEECLNLVRPNERRYICKKYIPIVQRSTDDYDKMLLKKAVTIRPPMQYCMPWPHKSIKGGKFHCKSGQVADLPFFFEVFDYQDFIKTLAEKFLKEKGLEKFNFMTVHYRAGNFIGRNDMKDRCFFDFKHVDNFATSIKNDTLPRYYMVQYASDLPPGKIFLSEDWLKKTLNSIGLSSFQNSLEFLKLLLDLEIASKASTIIGNNYSTLSEIVMSYALMQNSSVSFHFVS